jgi:DNA-binding transcriptional MerR regulator
MGQDNPSKVFYRVGEVGQLVGVESYVLRYWEKMFPQLKPDKDEAGQRVYTKSDIDVILRIKSLLYEERYTIDGARKRLREESRHKDTKDIRELLAILRNVKHTLQEISTILEKE